MQLFRPKYEVEECLKEIRGVLETGWTGTGPKCEAIQKGWQEFIGCKHALYLNSATAALHIALRLLDLPKGSKVITTPVTFVSTNAVIVYEGHEPVFCDVGADLSLRFDSVRDALTRDPSIRAIMWVHYGGNVSSDFYSFMFWLGENRKDVTVIEDCAHAAGAFYADGRRVGSRSDTLSCFSYQAVKNMPTFDSGMLCLANDAMHERAVKLSWLGIDKNTYARSGDASKSELYKWQYSVPELGWKYNGNDIAAAVGLVQLKYLDRDNAYRKAIYNWYRDRLEGAEVGFLAHADGSSHHLMVAVSEKRDAIMANLKAHGISPGVHYLPNYEFPAFAKWKGDGLPTVDRAAAEIISLPNHMLLQKADVDRVCDHVIEAAK